MSTRASSPERAQYAAPTMMPLVQEFDRWAASYDSAANPLLALEERSLAPFIPPLEGCDVLDYGCGTGRWLERCAQQQPASLTGIDISSRMLEKARAKLGDRATLHLLAGNTIPLRDASVDIVFSSFVLSYIPSLEAFTQECARIVRPCGAVLLSDMHPATASARGWKRGFRDEAESVTLPAQHYSLPEITSIFRRHGFATHRIVTPSFGAAEREMFAAAGKLEKFEDIATLPAIYILKLRRLAPGDMLQAAGASAIALNNARCTLGPATSIGVSLSMQHGRITEIGAPAPQNSMQIDLSGYLVLPGLVNAHDHLEFALFPNLGRASDRSPYVNATEWAREIHREHTATIARHRSVPLRTRLWWGAVRNLLCGVTTVCHHNDLYPELLDPELPLHVVTNFGWAHSLALEPELAERYHATSPLHPFILHAAEGVDHASAQEIDQLDRMHMLTERTVLVHGLSFTRKDADLMNRRQASLVACPTSNRFLFGRMPSRSLFTSLHRIALGSDSPLTASGDLLDEVRCLHEEIDVSVSTIYEMVTTGSAGILRLHRHEGRLRKRAIADLFAVRDMQRTPAFTLAQLDYSKVELVIVAGRVQIASQEIYDRLPEELRQELQPALIGGHLRWFGVPVAALIDEAEAVLGKGNVRLGGREVRHA